MRDKRDLPIQVAFILSLSIMLLPLTLKTEIVGHVAIFSLALVVVLAIFFVIAQFIERLRHSVWPTLIASAVIVYIGFFTIFLSMYQELIEQITWDVGMVALGLAVVGFGWGLFALARAKWHSHLDRLDEEMNELSVRIQSVNAKLSDLEKTADAFLEESHRLGRRLVSKWHQRDDVD